MSTTTSFPTSTSTSGNNTSGAPGSAQINEGISLGTFFASLAGSFIIFGVQLGIFILIKGKFRRLFEPRTYLVPERERTKPPPKGPWQWLGPVFTTTTSEFIKKCGLDAYFFLRYLQTLLKIFVPLAIVILPILLPLNAVHGRGSSFATGIYGHNQTEYTNVTGLDQLAWGNVRPEKSSRYWAHLILAIGVVIYTCFIFFDELRRYIRLRQAYLTSPEHRLRASATTVLVTAIPRKWCTYEALDGLYDVFPGGIRNIWINRNYDDLNDKVDQRNKLASMLESAETNLIKNAKKAHIKKLEKEAKIAGNTYTKEQKLKHKKIDEERAATMASTSGVSSGDPHQVRHTLEEALDEGSGQRSREQSPNRKKGQIPIPGVSQGLEAVGHGLDTIGKTVFKPFRTIGKDVNERFTAGGFALEEGQHEATDDHRNKPRATVLGKDPQAISDRTKQDASVGFQQDHAPAVSNTGDGHGQPYVDSGQVDGSNDAPRPVTSDSTLPNYSQLDGAINHSQPSNATGAKSSLKFWKFKRTATIDIPSPTPHGQEEDEFPLSRPSPMSPGANPQATINGSGSNDATRAEKSEKHKHKVHVFGHALEVQKTAAEYPAAYNKDLDCDGDGDPVWKKFLAAKDRDTMRLPIFGWQWMPSLPLIGEKVDTIYYCRREVARLNVEIEQDQSTPEKYPLMNSAFVQFNHQVAAHMACQSVSHHLPNQMSPRLVEISPGDVLWDNMSIKWWEKYIRTAVCFALFVGIVIGWAFPVTFTGLLSQVNYLTAQFSWLRWLNNAPTFVLSIIQGILPQALLGLLLLLLPVILRLLAKEQGAYTGMQIELTVQSTYFTFLFVQVFLVVSISSGITTTITQLANQPYNVPALLAANLPKASNYFFSYLLLQALSVSSGALLQLGSIFAWFVLAPLLDSTARQKWKRQINLPTVQWGTFFPVYTNLAAIGLIYSVISPLILVFNIVTFGLFWIVYRYSTLYVTKFRFDTGGLLYPKAINQLFTGLYVMELCLIGLFFLVRSAPDPENGGATKQSCIPQGIIMIIVLIFTVIYQVLLNYAFAPLFRYLPITLEDEAVIRDEEFARAQEKRWRLEGDIEEEANDDTGAREQQSVDVDGVREFIEMGNMGDPNNRGWFDPRNIGFNMPGNNTTKKSWADRSRRRSQDRQTKPWNQMPSSVHHIIRRRHATPRIGELESQTTDAIGEALFSGLNDEIEDLTPDERDKLVRRAFQHQALRARRPAIWIPRDDLGVSDDEIGRTQQFSKHIWITNEYTGLDAKTRVVYRRSPPDFSEVDLIEL